MMSGCEEGAEEGSEGGGTRAAKAQDAQEREEGEDEKVASEGEVMYIADSTTQQALRATSNIPYSEPEAVMLVVFRVLTSSLQ